MGIHIATLALTLACAMLPRIISAQILFSENWNSGSIDPAKWSIRGGTPNAIALEVPNASSAGDFALALRGTQDPDFPGTNPTWLDNIMSTMEFDRGDQVGMQFKGWNKPLSNAQFGVHGGFHHISLPPPTQQHYAQDLLCTPEAIFDYVVNDIRASESGDYIQDGPSFFVATAAIKAITKNSAATFRVTLDSVQGALWEVIIPPTNPAHSIGMGDAEVIVGRDTRGIPNLGEFSGHPNDAINDQILNAIGFGQFAGAAGTTYVDDIVEFGPDGPGLNGDFNLDEKVDAADYVVWRKADDSQAGYDLWRTNFGAMTGSGSLLRDGGAVPEPSTLFFSAVHSSPLASYVVATGPNCAFWASTASCPAAGSTEVNQPSSREIKSQQRCGLDSLLFTRGS